MQQKFKISLKRRHKVQDCEAKNHADRSHSMGQDKSFGDQFSLDCVL